MSSGVRISQWNSTFLCHLIIPQLVLSPPKGMDVMYLTDLAQSHQSPVCSVLWKFTCFQHVNKEAWANAGCFKNFSIEGSQSECIYLQMQVLLQERIPGSGLRCCLCSCKGWAECASPLHFLSAFGEVRGKPFLSQSDLVIAHFVMLFTALTDLFSSSSWLPRWPFSAALFSFDLPYSTLISAFHMLQLYCLFNFAFNGSIWINCDHQIHSCCLEQGST